MIVGLKHKGKRIDVEVKKCNLLQKAIGLMFSRRENARALVFDFKRPTREPIHSFFVFFPFIAIWVGENGKILEKRVVKPFVSFVRPAKKFKRLIEIPINDKYKKLVILLVGTKSFPKDLNT